MSEWRDETIKSIGTVCYSDCSEDIVKETLTRVKARLLDITFYTSEGDSNIVLVHKEDLNVAFKTSVVCLSMPREFFVSMNTTWNLVNNIEEMEAETFNFDSIYVTQVGLYNRNLDLIAVAKMDRPTEKTYTNIITFNLELDV